MSAPKKYPGVEQIAYRDRHGNKQVSRTWFIRFNWRGKQYREKTGVTDPKAAWDLLCQRKLEMRRGWLTGPASEAIRIGVLEKLVLDDYGNRGLATLPAVRLRFRYWSQWFGDKRMLEVTLADLNAAIDARRKGGSPFVRPDDAPAKPAAAGTIAVWLATLKRGFSLAVRSKLLPEAPPFPTVKPGPARKVIIDRALLNTLLEHLPAYLHPVFETALLTGWRKEAVLSREWRHVDLQTGRLTLDGAHAKNGEPIVIPLIGRLLAIFTEQDERARELGLRIGRVIPDCFFYPADAQNVKAGSRIKDFDHQFRAARRKLGMPQLHFHAIRKGAVRTLRHAGASEHEIMEWVGLKTASVFRRYDIVDDERMRDTAERLDSFYERQEASKVTPIRKEI